jgi:hypothetical protein
MQKKLLYFTSAFLLLSVVSFAQKSNMIFFTPNEEKFYLVVNGIQQNGQPLSNVKITEMAAPVIYNVKIKFEDPKLAIINDKVSLEPGTEKSWAIQGRTKKGSSEIYYVIKTSAEIPLDDVAATNNSFPQEQVIVYHTEPLPNANADGVTFSMNVNEQGGNISFNVNDGGGTTTSSSTTTTTTTTSSSNVVVGNGNCSRPMDAIAFRQQLDRVRTQGTAAGKKIVAEKIAQTNCLTSQQVYELCDALYMSADKLALAKYCYGRCYDPQNYEEVYKALPTSTMVNELDDYIRRVGQPVQQTTTTTTVPVRVEYVPGYNGPYGCVQPMSAASFASAKNSIQDADFENTKMSTAKTIVGSNCLTTDQVVEICKLFDFENSKLEFAKFAYPKTYDKGNYFKVNTVFDFDASKEDLNKYVQNK